MTNLIEPNRVRFGPYEADLHTHELWKFGTKVKLVGQPFEILGVLVSKPGELVTREELRERLWPGETFVDFNHGLNAAVNKLRDVLCDSAEDPKYIETLPRRGYRFIAKVERGVEPATTATPLPSLSPALEPTLPEPPPADVARKPGPRRRWMIPTAAIVVAVLFGIFVSVHGILQNDQQREERQKREAERTFAPLAGPPAKGVQLVLVSGGRNEGPQFSPDGKRVVFMSDRVGGKNLWVVNADGSNLRQLTTVGDTGTPRWSPDGKMIAFDTHFHKYTAVAVVDADGGTPRLVVSNNSNNNVPSWSQDGKFLYFASDRTGDYQVWKADVATGQALQVTRSGGFAAFEAADRRTVYYAKTQFPQPEIWRTDGSSETEVWPPIRPAMWATWALQGDRLYYVENGLGDVAVLSVLDLSSQKFRQMTVLGRFPFWLAVSPDGKKALFDRNDSDTSTPLIEVEDFE